VVGSPGSGKSTLAVELAHTLGHPHVELDAIFHQPGWTPLDEKDFLSRVRAEIEQPTWVVDGNYSTVRTVVWEEADTVVFLDLPLHVVVSRLVPRTVRRVFGRTELWNGNREPFSHLWSVTPEKSIIAWSIANHDKYHRRYTDAMIDPRWDGLRFVQLCTPSQVDQFLKHAHETAESEGAN
jgi:adenylate kinase family enzyme